MGAGRASVHSVRALLWIGAALAAGTLAANRPAPLQLGSGARVGVVSVLDAEVTHFHSALQLQASFLKTYTVTWPVSAMLLGSLQAQLNAAGLVAVPMQPGAALLGMREECFLNANLTKALSKECAVPYAQLLTAAHLDAIIVLGPGLNNAQHAAGTRRRQLPEYLRGWCMLTDAKAAASTPTLLNLTELLIIANTPNGPVLAGREWGGTSTSGWIGFTPPPDLKQLGDAQLDPAQPLFAAMLRSQAEVLLARVPVAHQGP